MTQRAGRGRSNHGEPRTSAGRAARRWPATRCAATRCAWCSTAAPRSKRRCASASQIDECDDRASPTPAAPPPAPSAARSKAPTAVGGGRRVDGTRHHAAGHHRRLPARADAANRDLLARLSRWLQPKVKTIDLLLFSRQLHTLLRSGVPILRALAGLQESATTERMKRHAGRGARAASTRASSCRCRSPSTPSVFNAFYVVDGARRRDDRAAR